jgi:hypothetical protein
LEELTVVPQVLPVMTPGATSFDNEFVRHLLRLTILTRSTVGTRIRSLTSAMDRLACVADPPTTYNAKCVPRHRAGSSLPAAASGTSRA